MSHFQLKFDISNLVYQGELSDLAISEIPSQRIENSELGQSKEQDQILFSNIRDIKENSVRDKVNKNFHIKLIKKKIRKKSFLRMLRLTQIKRKENIVMEYDY